MDITTTRLSHNSKNALKTGGYVTLEDLLVTPLNEVARKCRISTGDAKAIYDTLLKEFGSLQIPSLDALSLPVDETFSTGDAYLDQALNGGVRTGMVWEVVGESAAGKSQLALQLSLAVQNSPDYGGISGACCYLTTSSQLPTGRLAQILESNPSLPEKNCNLSNVHTIKIGTIDMLTSVLTNLLPGFIQQHLTSSHPVKLVIIDALTELFHSADKTSKSSLFDRSKELNKLSSTLHALATMHNIAVVVINEVADRFERGASTSGNPNAELVYSEQSRHFNTCDSVPGENTKEASLGLVWANQVNVRILMSRTRRRRYVDPNELQHKRARLPSPGPPPSEISTTEEQATLIRRMSIVFSSVCPSTSMDYIIAQKGVVVLSHDSSVPEGKFSEYHFAEISNATASQQHAEPPSFPIVDGEDEYDRLLNTSELPYDAYYDAFEQQLTQPQLQQPPDPVIDHNPPSSSLQ
ncbi:P-loop containing nucleoside triphosphate hydrolase protein [Coprinopsis sp. MPI-PUGE-AT-0042]|nr:P-loop containing nucleoside triphosphate hydrolase protein [Coprinopsis sp. MPI-PUGE-AT-0042]